MNELVEVGRQLGLEGNESTSDELCHAVVVEAMRCELLLIRWGHLDFPDSNRFIDAIGFHALKKLDFFGLSDKSSYLEPTF